MTDHDHAERYLGGLAENPAQRTAEESRSALVAAARTILARQGIAGDPVGVDLGAAIAEAGIPRSTAYRLFTLNGGKPQENFTTEVVSSLINKGVITDFEVVVGQAAEVFAAYPADVFQTGTGRELATILRELIRVVMRANMMDLVATQEFWIYMGALASVGAHGTEPTLLREAMTEAEKPGQFMEFLRDICELFGLRMKEGWTWNRVDALFATAMFGTALRLDINPELEDIMRPTGPDGELQSWNAGAVLIEGYVLVAFEPNPRVVNAADLTLWLEND